VQSLRAEYRATLVETAEQEERIEFLTRQLQRQEMLKERGMSRADVYDEARQNLQAARSRLQSIHEMTNRVLAGLVGDPQLPAERHPRFSEAKAAYDAAQVDLARTQVTAPSDGVVSNMKLQVGEHVEKGAQIFSLVQSGAMWVEANFKETQLTHMRVGQRAQVVADAYPDIEFNARVAAIAPATGAEFAILPPQNATGNWVKVVQRVPVRIQVDQPPGHSVLRAGMTVTVSVDTGRERGLPRFVQRLIEQGYLPRFLGYGTCKPRLLLEVNPYSVTLVRANRIERGAGHEYDFPLPPSLSGRAFARRFVVTLSWLSPVSPGNYLYRRAALWAGGACDLPRRRRARPRRCAR